MLNEMDSATATSIVISLVYLVLQFILAGFLYKRSRATGMKDLNFVFLAFLLGGLAGGLGLAWRGFRTILYPLSAIIMIPFVHHVFYEKRRSPYRLILALSIGLYIFAVVLRILYEFLQDLHNDAMYYTFVVDIVVIFFTCYGWFFTCCYRTYKSLKGVEIEPWARWRYKILAISCIFAVFTAAVNLVNTSHDEFHQYGSAWKVVQAITFLLFALASFLGWCTPEGIKGWLNLVTGYIPAKVKDIANQDTSQMLSQKLSAMSVMTIIDYVGNKLAPRIGQSPNATKGLLLVSLEGATKEANLSGLNFSALHHVLVHDVKNRLEQLGVKNASEILSDMAADLVDKQSLFVLLAP